jgi:hypothetical protein
MKLLVLATVFFVATANAQNLDVRGLKALLMQRQALLETVSPGMSKRIASRYTIETEAGRCEVTETADQTVLKIDAEKLIVFSRETYQVAPGAACAGVENQNVSVVFYEARPTLAADLADLDAVASQIRSISRAGDVVTLGLSVPVPGPDGPARTDAVTVRYDLAKPGFRNTLLVQDSTSAVSTSDLPDVDVNSIDLRKVLFCTGADSDECVEGDWSDILF